LLEQAIGIEAVLRAIRKATLNADDALPMVDLLKVMGLIDVVVVKNSGSGAVPFVQFLETFWHFDKSPYIQDRLAHGYRFSKRYAHEC